MRLLAITLLMGITVTALAQEAPPPPAQPAPYAQPPPAPQPDYGAPPPNAPLPPPPTLPPLTMPARPYISAKTRAHWTGARVLYGFGGAFSLIGTGLSLSSTIYLLATDYPPSLSSASGTGKDIKASDPQQALTYASSASSAVGFAFSAAGLGWQHKILRDLHADPGRGLYISGDVIGILGFVAIGVGYFFALTDTPSNPSTRSIAALSTSLGGSALCSLAGILFAKDSSTVRKVWRNLTSF